MIKMPTILIPPIFLALFAGATEIQERDSFSSSMEFNPMIEVITCAVYSYYDEDRSRTISFEEFSVALRHLIELLPPPQYPPMLSDDWDPAKQQLGEKLKSHILQFDWDGNTQFSRDELRMLFTDINAVVNQAAKREQS